MTSEVAGFDFHCHVDLYPDPANLISRCEGSRIFTLAVTTTPKAWPQNVRWTDGKSVVIPALGFHPELAGERLSEIDLLEELMPQTAFVGEIGLDGSPPHRGSWDAQKEVFTRTIERAQGLGGRVLSIHSRRAAREVLASLAVKTTRARVLPILHWFSDGPGLAGEAASQGCYFSVNSRMLATEAGLVLARRLPLDRILTETDGPFTDYGTRRSEPADVSATVAKLAEVRNTTQPEMTRVIADNAARVLSFAGVSIGNL